MQSRKRTREEEDVFLAEKRREESVSSTIELPPEILLKVMETLPLGNIGSFGTVNHAFNHVSSDNHFWKLRYKEYFPLFFASINEKGCDAWQAQFATTLAELTLSQLFNMKLEDRALDFFWNRFLQGKLNLENLDMLDPVKNISLRMAIFCKRPEKEINAAAARVHADSSPKPSADSVTSSSIFCIRNKTSMPSQRMASIKTSILKNEVSYCWSLAVQHDLIDQAKILLKVAKAIFGEGSIDAQALAVIATKAKSTDFTVAISPDIKQEDPMKMELDRMYAVMRVRGRGPGSN